MRLNDFHRVLAFALFMASAVETPVFAQDPPPCQEPPSSQQETTACAKNTPSAVAPAAATASHALTANSQIIVPVGTRLPLVLRNAVSTRTAKPGDSVYFETVYPIAVNNRIVIPMGTFVRGEILETKRPGRIGGRGRLRMALQQMTYPNGYIIELLASPSSVDPNTGSGVNAQKTIEGPSSRLRDTTAVLLTTAGGAYIGAVAGAVNTDAPGKGALIGGGVGGIGALIAVLATRGTTMDVVLDRPLLLDAAYLPAAGAGPGIDPQPRYVPVQTQSRERRREPLPRMLPLLFLPLLR